jgi:RimJ/RimL family protein N-acetyltransferase
MTIVEAFMKISFNLLKEEHFPLLLNWLEQQHVKKYWDTDVTYTLDSIKEKYRTYVKGFKIENEVNKPIDAYIINLDDIPLGYIQLYNAYDFPRNKSLTGLPENLGALDFFIGESKYLGQNLGSAIVIEFVEQYANNYTHIFLDPEIHNIAAIKCYQKAGFKKFAQQQDTKEVWMLKRVKKVRLSDHDLDALEFVFKKSFMKDDKLWLFGSRVDLSKKGGDIDLYIETTAKDVKDAVKMKLNFMMELESKIGEQKIDVVLNMLNYPYPLPIHDIAKAKGLRIV